MPGGDRTGPMGMGPMTGRAAGYCAGYAVPGFANPIPGRGLGLARGRVFGRGFWGRGRGYGRGWMYPYSNIPYGVPYVNPHYSYPYGAFYSFPPTMTPDQEAEMLKAQAEELKNGLEDINKRISDLESAAEKKE